MCGISDEIKTSLPSHAVGPDLLEAELAKTDKRLCIAEVDRWLHVKTYVGTCIYNSTTSSK